MLHWSTAALDCFMHVQEKCIVFISNGPLCCILYATVHASVCTHLASSADWVKSNIFRKTQIVQYLKLDSWCRCQWEIWSNHPHNAAILTAHRTIPHWNQLKCTMPHTRQKHNVRFKSSLIQATRRYFRRLSVAKQKNDTSASVHIPRLEEHQSTPGRSAAHKEHPLLGTLEGRFLAPADDCKALLSAECLGGRPTQKGCVTCLKPEAKQQEQPPKITHM